MIKTVLSGSFGFDDSVAAIVPMHKAGCDFSWIEKRSSQELFDFAKLAREIKPHEALVHLLALGDGETVGANRNGDYFPKAANVKYHHTFKKAHYFHDHNNKDPKLSFGRVVAAAHNEPMGRVELVVAIDTNKAANDLDELEKKGEFPVSMSCFEDPKTPIFTARGYIPIEDVVVGDLVPTHEGRWQRVSEVIKRQYTGEMVDFKVRGMPRTFSVTSEHPFYAMKQKVWAEAVKGCGRNDEVEVEDSPNWNHAGCLEYRDRIMGIVPPAIPGVAVIDDTNLAQLLGYYTAEGSLQYNRDKQTKERRNPCTVNYCVNGSDSAVTRIPQIMHDLWPDVTVTIRPNHMSDVCFNLSVHSTKLAMYIRDAVGTGAHTKYLPLGLFGATDEVKLAYLGAWLDGDGWADKKGLHWSSVNETLILAGRDLLASLGIGASIYRIDHRGQKNAFSDSYEYTLNLSLLDISRFRPWSAKAAACEIEIQTTNKACSYRPIGNGLASCSIREPNVRHVKDVTVYNFEVEEDHSYSAAGLASHNCRVLSDECSCCGNVARNRSEYCKHAKNMMGQIMEDGKMAYVINHHPDFFDISKVWRGADRVAFTFRQIEKAASDNRIIGGAELAELLKVSELAVPTIQSAYIDEKVAIFNKLASINPNILTKYANAFVSSDIDPKDLNDLCSVSDKPAVFGALSLRGVCLSPESFFKLAGIDTSEVPEVEVRAAIRQAIPRIKNTGLAYSICKNGSYDGNTSVLATSVVSKINKIAALHSILPEQFIRRALDKVASGVPETEKSASNLSEPRAAANILADEYTSYLVSFAREASNNDTQDFVQNLTILRALG